jgi:molybdate transport system regulatory protein
MKVRFNIWLEANGQVALSAWRIRLFEAIEETGSISQGAKAMRIPYRRAWEKIQECEAQWGFRLIETQTGGVGGGGATLTPECKKIIATFNLLVDGVDQLLQSRFNKLFADEQG